MSLLLSPFLFHFLSQKRNSKKVLFHKMSRQCLKQDEVIHLCFSLGGSATSRVRLPITVYIIVIHMDAVGLQHVHKDTGFIILLGVSGLNFYLACKCRVTALCKYKEDISRYGLWYHRKVNISALLQCYFF